MDAIPRSTLSAQDWFSYSTFWVSVWILRFFSISMKKNVTEILIGIFLILIWILPLPSTMPLFLMLPKSDQLGVGCSSVQMPRIYGDISWELVIQVFKCPRLMETSHSNPSFFSSFSHSSFPSSLQYHSLAQALLFFQAICPFIPHFSFSSLSLSFFLVSTPLTTFALTYVHGYIYYKLGWHMR